MPGPEQEPQQTDTKPNLGGVAVPEIVERLPYPDTEAIRRAEEADRAMIERISQPV